MKRSVITIALSLLLLSSMVLASRQDDDHDHSDGNRGTSDRCRFNSANFQRRNNGMLASLAGSRAQPIPSQLWQQDVYFMIQLQSGDWLQVANYIFYQYNYWNQSRCSFVSEHYAFTVFPDGRLGIEIDEVNADPLEPTFRTRGGNPQEGVQEYDVYWHNKPTFNNAGPGYSPLTSQVAMTNSTDCYTFMDFNGKVLGTETIDIIEANEDRDYSIMLYYPGQPTGWAEIDSTNMDFPPLISAVRNAFVNGQVPLQQDPLATAAGITYTSLIWDVPTTAARGVSDINFADVTANYKAYEPIKSRMVASLF